MDTAWVRWIDRGGNKTEEESVVARDENST